MNREDVAMDVTVQNVEILRNRVAELEHPEQAEGAQGHGHVTPRADGVKARCGGPAMCKVCQAEQARTALAQPSQKSEQRLVECDACPTSGGCVEVCMKAPAQPSPARQVVMKEICPSCEHQFVSHHNGYINRLRGVQQPSPAPELERPEVVAFLNEWRDRDQGGIRVTPALSAMSEEGLKKEYAPLASVVRREPLMTVSQHDRIGMQWASLVHRAQAKADAAQARVAELEKQEPAGWKPSAGLLSQVEALGCGIANCAGTNNRTGARDKIDQLLKLLAAPVAQAGQVPDSAASAKALVEIEAKKYSLNAAGMFNSGAPDHGQTIAVQELLAGFDDDEAEGHWEAIMAYSDLRASDALFHAAELLAAAPAQGGE